MHNSVSFSLVTSLNWHIKSNADNCKVVHMGKVYPSLIYKIMSSDLTIAFQEKGFRAMIENSTKNISSDLITQTHKLHVGNY